MPKFYSVFLDANVWFAAACSKTGASFLIMQLAKRRLVQIFANQHVLDEAERNLLLKSPENVVGFYSLVSETRPTVIHETMPIGLSQRLGKLVPLSDVPVIAGALMARSAYLVSLDRRHIVSPKLTRLNWPFVILLPGDLLQKIRNDHEAYE